MPAPYSDNLYSAVDDSDEEHDALSPTDGYFRASTIEEASSPTLASPSAHQRTLSNVPLVPNVLVEDPSLPGGSKAREAEEERRLNSGNPASPRSSVSHATSPYQYQHQPQPQSSSHHHHRRSVEEDPSHPGLVSPLTRNPPNLTTPLSQHRDAPPAYTPSPTSQASGYQTFGPSSSTMGLPEEQQRLLPRGPESMGGPPAGSGPSRWQRLKDAWSSANVRRRIKTVLGVLVILSVVFILVSAFSMKSGHKLPKHPDTGKDKEDPVKSPPEMGHGDFTWQPLDGCYRNSNGPYKQEIPSNAVDFHPSRNLTVIQEVERDDRGGSGWHPKVWGQLLLRPTTGSSPGKVDVEAITNSEHISVRTEFNKETQVLRVETPKRVDWSLSAQAPCIQLRITVWAPQETLLTLLYLHLTHLDVEILDELDLSVLDKTLISTVAGNVKTSKPQDDSSEAQYKLHSREIYVHTVSGNVEGSFPLYDVLSIQTASGDITTKVTTKPVSPDDPRPATLHVESVSGHIDVREPLDRALAADKPDKEFPPRDYIAKMASSSGDITAVVATSSLADFRSQSGDLTLKLWPVLDSGLLKATAGRKPVLITDTKSGDTKLELLQPVWTSLRTVAWPGLPESPATPGKHRDHEHRDPEMDDPWIIIHPDSEETPHVDTTTIAAPALSILKSKHTSVSGDVELRYPHTWEGTLEAETISGSQTVRGEGLQVTKVGKPYLRRIVARKGNGDSELNVQTVSGDEHILVGESK